MYYRCKFCNKEFDNKRSKGQHESFCDLNPNKRYSWNKGKSAKTDDRILKSKETFIRRYKNGEIKFNPHIWTQEEKNNLSKKRKEWLMKNPDKHPWRNMKHNRSEPCEVLKDFLRKNSIQFIEEYNPKIQDHNYSLDIAFPDIKFAIEVNGNQHYNNDGSLNESSLYRHKLLEANGWKILELHYTKCYNFDISILDKYDNIEDFYDKDYVGKYFSRKEERKRKIEEERKQIIENKKRRKFQKEEEFIERKKILLDLLNNSNIDFNKFGWVNKAHQYLSNKNVWFHSNMNRQIKKYIPEYINSFFWRHIRT